MFQQLAIETIHQAITENGLLASANTIDNYARIWSRDSAMTGLAGILIQDEKIIKAQKQSILTLASHQLENGQIPTNVLADKNKTTVSYGTLVGRVDATTWWIVSACTHILHTQDAALKQKLEAPIALAFSVLKSWEYNNRDLLYTPIGGNWADEYITSGYTLYDNTLRYWALHLAAKVYNNEMYAAQALHLKQVIKSNFSTQHPYETKFHARAYTSMAEKKYPYMLSSFSANGYSTYWDMAGNALALLLDLNSDVDALDAYLQKLITKFNHSLLPVFYPVITKKDWQWNLLENNYSYNFKNNPYHFHNGGSWPIYLGWLCMGLQANNKTATAMQIENNYEQLMQQNPTIIFNEYWATDTLLPGGVNKLCFSASGYLFMKNANQLHKIIN